MLNTHIETTAKICNSSGKRQKNKKESSIYLKIRTAEKNKSKAKKAKNSLQKSTP